TEREIVIGNTSQLGAGYLHPACARLHLDMADLADRLRENSKLLEDADVDALVAAIAGEPAAPAMQAAPKVVARGEAPAPTTPWGGGLAPADGRLEKGDARGELIAIAPELTAPTDEARRRELGARAAELEKGALAKWKKEIDTAEVKVVGLF